MSRAHGETDHCCDSVFWSSRPPVGACPSITLVGLQGSWTMASSSVLGTQRLGGY